MPVGPIRHYMDKMAYAAMVGKYIRMERPARADELENGAPETIGMECTVAVVVITSAGVEVCSDYGYSFLVSPEQESDWTFHVWSDEKTCKEMRM